MSQKFTPLAQSRASYYCKGSPVHFVMVELFRMEGTGATVVTLTFKNLFSRPLVSFTAYFRCKNKYGEVVVEDSFTYDNVYAGEGECFGFDDAVFVSDEPLGSVEVRLGSVTYDDGAPHDLRRCPGCGAACAAAPAPARTRGRVPRLGHAGCGLLPRGGCRRLALHLRRVQLQRGPRHPLLQRVRRGKGADAGGRARCAERRGAGTPPVWCGYAVLPCRTKRPPAAPAGSGAAACSMLCKSPGCRARCAAYRSRKWNGRPFPAMGGAPQACVSIMKDSTADFILRYMPFVTMAAAAVFTMGAVLVSQYLL